MPPTSRFTYGQRLKLLSAFHGPALAAWVVLAIWRADLDVRAVVVLYLAGGVLPFCGLAVLAYAERRARVTSAETPTNPLS